MVYPSHSIQLCRFQYPHHLKPRNMEGISVICSSIQREKVRPLGLNICVKVGYSAVSDKLYDLNNDVEHFDRAYKTIELAFVNGPLQHYLNDTPVCTLQ